MNKDWSALRAGLEKWKYPLLILFAGILLMLAPGTDTLEDSEPDRQLALAQLLSSVRGVGEAKVLISENGVVVVCGGASNASVRLDIIHAVSSYTGFGSDKITILKLRN